MSLATESNPVPSAAAAPTAAARWRARVSDYATLTKPGITRMVLLTAAVGFYLASPGPIDWLLLAHTLFGVALAASGTNALNQFVERELDALMVRTRTRPLPSGRLDPVRALVFAATISTLGIMHLAAFVNALTAVLVAISLISYVFIYTPLKRRTTLATIVGAVPGALPILAGWTAAADSLQLGGWALFWILFLWQMPHFLALAWLFRDDYRRGGFVMLSVLDADGRETGTQALLYAVALLPVSLIPTLLDLTGALYFGGALLLGTIFALFGLLLMMQRSEQRARRLFLTSVLYLPALLVLMVIDKVAA